LRDTPHAMTREGLMSGKAQHFDKQDQKRLDQDWMTGFDNRDRLAQLERQVAAQQSQWQSLVKEKQAALSAQKQAADQRQLWGQIVSVRWDDLDMADLEARRQALQRRKDALLNPQSDAALAHARWEQAKAASRRAEEALRGVQRQEAELQAEYRLADQRCTACQQRVAAQVVAGDQALEPESMRRWLPELVRQALSVDTLEASERQAVSQAATEVQSQGARLAELHKEIIRQMGRAHKEDRGALAEQLQEVEALPHYLERLRALEEEALPEKRERFQEYLNNASDQGVSTLLNGIEAQVSDITERMAELNRTLERVDFLPGRYLQLDPQPVVHPVLQELHKTLARLRSERLRDDAGQSHYQALQTMVQLLREHATNRRTKAAQALLDARYRLQFAVHVMDRASGDVLERRTGSQGGSGGEKEIIASYVLTASLSYALCPTGRSQPLFGTIVLDEAFSKSSQAVAARIIQALREFGLHALFVTPNKELRLLRQHTRSAVLVHRRERQATLACLSWQELDAHAQLRKAAQGVEARP